MKQIEIDLRDIVIELVLRVTGEKYLSSDEQIYLNDCIDKIEKLSCTQQNINCSRCNDTGCPACDIEEIYHDGQL